MKFIYTVSITILLLFSTGLFAQKKAGTISLRTGELVLETNLRQSAIDSFNKQVFRYHNKTVFVLQFRSIPSEASRKLLSQNAIELLDFIGNNAYTAIVTGNVRLQALQQAGCNTFHQLSPDYKLEPGLARGILPAYAVKTPGTVDVWIIFAQTFSLAEVNQFLSEKNIAIIGTEWSAFGQLSLRIAPDRLLELASFPFILYVQAVLPDPEPLNKRGRNVSRANVLNTPVANGGKGLNGEGVVIGIGDDGDIQKHVDFSGRLINRNFLSGSHGVHVSGTAAGAGIVNELYRGYAPKSVLITNVQGAILQDAPVYIYDHNMVLTNNSYGSSPGCQTNGLYSINARTLDYLALAYPEVLHVFAAGNDGTISCTPYPPGFNTITPEYQSAKNILTVGATNDSAFLSAFSSKGPVKDGRIKPEITAMGVSVISSWPDNRYSSSNGTSMAAPAVTGGAALLYQRYRQLHNNANPASALVKAILCNGADDRGNPGPDYAYGFGSMNLVRSIEILEKHHYFNDNVADGASNTHTILVPANTAQLKVMLYWSDPFGSPISRQALVNDLDVEVVTPASATVLPKILDTLPPNVNNVAINGADHTNNIEQVIIGNPDAGIYTIKVKGGAIPQGPMQEYYLVYDVVPESVNITYPAGGEGLVPGEFVKLSWDAYGNIIDNSFNLDYSVDNGNSWISIAMNLDAERRLYTWRVPNVVASNALVRVMHNGSGMTSVSHPFTIIGVPVVALGPSQCEGSILIQWAALQDASAYEVMILKGDTMQTAGITNDTSWYLNGLSPDSVYWVAVRARIADMPGRRSVAISRQPNNGNCGAAYFDNDLKLDTILSPLTGRKYTSTELTSTQTIKLRIKNLDNAASAGFTVKYSINAGPWIEETVSTTVAAGAVYEHSFAETADLSATGNYTLIAVVKNLTPDPITSNDTLVVRFRHLNNQLLTINPSAFFLNDLETAIDTFYRADTRGLAGLDRYDFENATVTGELRTFFNTGVAYSGQRSFNLGEHITRSLFSKGLNRVTGTFNLSDKSVNANDIKINFRYLVNLAGANNDVWARGSDTSPWIKVFDFNNNLNSQSERNYRLSKNIEISDSLAVHGQDFSSSFQIRWSESGFLPKYPYGRMYSIDDIRIYEVQNDLELVSIDMPVSLTCGLSSAVPVMISVYNSNNAPLADIPVKYSPDGINWITETIPFIAGNSGIQYQFNRSADLSVQGSHKLYALVSHPGDTYRENDTTLLTLRNLPLIDNYPHLQNFELDNGGWYTEDVDSPWEYGTPASSKINRAASGTKAWKTNLAGNYKDNNFSYLYSPCYQINGMAKPTLSFSLAMDVETCIPKTCDFARVEYSVDGGAWKTLGVQGDGTNWYNAFTHWQLQDYTRWHVATVPLPVTSGLLRLRLQLSADAFGSGEGIAIDDIHIYDNDKGIYDGAGLIAPLTKSVTGNDWINFESNGQLIASINPHGQNMGSTNVQAYINTSPVRYTGSQYYHDRNIVIHPAIPPNDSVTVRFYFLDKESEELINATGCQLCTKPSSAYELGVSKYSNAVRTVENGDMADDNLQGTWDFIQSGRVKKVPLDKGYYAEFKVKDFSEFWLNNGGLDLNSPLPAQVFEFTAQRTTGNDVLLQWTTGNESGVAKYEVELARGNDAFQNNQFEKIGELPAQHGATVQHYNFTDRETDKFGPRYYRLKIPGTNGSFNYSPIHMVEFDEAVLWKFYPNPSSGVFYLVCQFTADQKLRARIIDTKGRLITEYSTVATGVPQKLNFDLSFAAAGIYLVQLDDGNTRQVFKIYKK